MQCRQPGDSGVAELGRYADARIGLHQFSEGVGAAASSAARDRLCTCGNQSEPTAIVRRRRVRPRGENLSSLFGQRKVVHFRRENEKSHYAHRAIQRLSQDRGLAQKPAGNVVLSELHHRRRGYSRQSLGALKAGESWLHPHSDVRREGIE